MSNEELRKKLNSIVASDKIVLFMKGVPSFPLCGLSGNVCLMLKKCNLRFRSVNIMFDPELHIFLQNQNSTLSMPHLYLCGNFLGGYDEIEKLYKSGYLHSLSEQLS